MPICVDCKKECSTGMQEIHTQRKTVIYICNNCIKKYRRKEANSARDS